MVQLQFNSADHPDDRPGGVPLRAGWYGMWIESIEQETSRAGNELLKVTLAPHPDYHPDIEARRIFFRLNLWHDKETVAAIAHRELGQMVRACGLVTIDDTDELVGQTIAVKLKVEEGKGEYGPDNRPTAFEPIENRDAHLVQSQGAPGSAAARPTGTPPRSTGSGPAAGRGPSRGPARPPERRAAPAAPAPRAPGTTPPSGSRPPRWAAGGGQDQGDGQQGYDEVPH